MSADVRAYAAVDLGASSGRVMVGRVGPGSLELTEAHRFPNRPVRVPEGLRWDVLGLYAGVLDGLRAAGPVDSVGIDSWAVDYGLLDADGALLGNPVHYRDTRTDGVARTVWETVPADELYAATGLQYAPFNTLYQLAAARSSAQLAHAERLLLIPDLMAYWLTGEQGTELTNASTTQLIDPRTRDWAYGVADRLGVDLSLFAPLRSPGDPAGLLRAEVLEETGLTGPVPVTAVGSHDTASAVAAVPAEGERFAYICTGTWSLAGLELRAPVLTEESRAANFTNELGLDGTVRYLRNIMGLWLLQECLRAWGDPELDGLLREGGPGARAAVGRGRGRRRVPGAGPDAGAGRRGVPGVGAAGARDARRDHPLHPGLARAGAPEGRPGRAAPRRSPGRRRARGRGRGAQHPAVPADGRRVRAAGGRRPGRGRRPGPRPRPGAGPPARR